MAAASNPAVSIQSPRAPGEGGAALNSPKSTRRLRGGVSSSWTHVVRGGIESEPIVTAPATGSPSGVPPDQIETNESLDDSVAEVQHEIADNGGGGGSNAAKKPAWNKPSNGVVEVSPVMGAVSWPALGESTKASPKSASSDSLKALPDAPLPTLQVIGNSNSSSNKQVISSNPNPVAPTRQRSIKRGGGGPSGSVSANGGFSQPHSPQPQDSVGEIPANTSGKPAAVAESSPRDHPHKESQRGGFGSQSHGGNEQQHQRNSFRRGNGGPHPRGDGSYHHSYGGKRDQDRGNQEWNPHNRSFGPRDAHLQPQRGFPRGFIRPSVHTSTPFIPPPVPVPVRTFGNPMVYPDVASPVIYVQGPPPPDSLRAMPIVAPIPPHAMFFPVPDPQLHVKIVNQIDYYFSNENLVKDTFLRQNMDDQGWVPIKLIAGFKKVTYLTENISLIIEAMRTSTVVEVQGDKVRRRNDWMKWIMPPPVQFSNVSSPRTVGMSSHDMLASNLQNVALDEKISSQVHAENFFSRSSSGEFNSQLLHSGVEGMGQVSSQAGFERPTKA